MVQAKTAVPSGRAFCPWLHLSSGLKASMAFNQVRNPATPYTISADIGGALLDFKAPHSYPLKGAYQLQEMCWLRRLI